MFFFKAFMCLRALGFKFLKASGFKFLKALGSTGLAGWVFCINVILLLCRAQPGFIACLHGFFRVFLGECRHGPLKFPSPKP